MPAPNTASSGSADATPTPLGRIVRLVVAAASREPAADSVEAVEELFPPAAERREHLVRFATLIALSSAIAGFGLLADSAGVVIGAMLVAPLMTPILAASAATVQADNRRLVGSLATVAFGTALAIAVGYLVALVAADAIAGTSELPGELEARTYPGLLDLGIAVSAGAAAGYIVPRRSAISALPGVGIAVALVPPLATVGITWQIGRHSDATNALLLYLTNLAAIVFAASLMLVLAGFRLHVRVSRRVLVTRVLTTFAAVTAVAIPLTVHTRRTVEDAQLTRIVAEAIGTWDPAARVLSVDAHVDSGVARVAIVVTGPNDPDEVWTIAEEIRDRFDRPVELDLRYQQDGRFEVTAR